MKVQELLNALRDVDADSTVLFLAEHADADDADEVCEVYLAPRPWTYELGDYGGRDYQSWYPYRPEQRGSAYTSVRYESRRVVVLSTGPTNLRFVRPEDMLADLGPDER
jgi:hypothetical protein